MRRKCLAAAILLLALALSGCSSSTGTDAAPTPAPTLDGPMFESLEAVTGLYNEITFDDTLETLTERYGEPLVNEDDNGVSYRWTTEDRGAAEIIFYESGRMRAKTVYFTDVRRFGALSASTGLNSVFDLSTDFTLENASVLLGGEPIEISKIAMSSSLNPDYNVGYVWGNANGDSVRVLFDEDGKVTNVAYSFQN